MRIKFGARKDPMADTAVRSTPTNRSDLCLNLTAKKPISKAKTTSAALFTVLVWAAMPVGTWNVVAKSLVNNLSIGVDKPTAKKAAVIDGINSLLGELVSEETGPSLIFLADMRQSSI